MVVNVRDVDSPRGASPDRNKLTIRNVPAVEWLAGEGGVWRAVRERGERARASGALQPISTATTVRVRDGKTQTTDGPFAETKEQLGGYYLLNCKDLDEAIEYAAKIPSAVHGTIEIRPIMKFD